MRTKSKRALGYLLVFLGILSILTPFTPFGILFLVGLELLGVRKTYYERAKAWFDKKRGV